MSVSSRAAHRQKLRSKRGTGAPRTEQVQPSVLPGSVEPRPDTRAHLALFDKCHRYTRARDAQAAGLYPYFRPISESEDTVVTIEGRKRIMLGSNNYLGLTHHPKVLEAADDRVAPVTAPAAPAVAFLNGTLDICTVELEEALADFLGKEDCLVFSTGYMANLGLRVRAVDRRRDSSSWTSSTTPRSSTARGCPFRQRPSGSITVTWAISIAKLEGDGSSNHGGFDDHGRRRVLHGGQRLADVPGLLRGRAEDTARAWPSTTRTQSG